MHKTELDEPFMREITMHEFEECPPESDTVTSYDRKCFRLYAMLLDADALGTEWSVAYELSFRRSIGEKKERARRQYSAHLERAKWMTISGYRQLL